MTRGNQRDADRAKAQKKLASGAKKPTESSAALAKRREEDAAAMRAKQQKALDAKKTGNETGS